MFKERIVEPIPVVPDSAMQAKFVELQQGLLDLLAPELRRAFRNKAYSDVLAFIALLKRSVSTVAACRASLTVGQLDLDEAVAYLSLHAADEKNRDGASIAIGNDLAADVRNWLGGKLVDRQRDRPRTRRLVNAKERRL